MTFPAPARTLALAIIGALGIGIAAFGVAWSNMNEEQRAAIWPELSKFGMQTIVVAVAGALVTVALKLTEEQREEAQKAHDVEREVRERRNDYRLLLLRRLRTAYTNIKRARRQLETAGFKDRSGPLPAPSVTIYKDALTALTEAKLEIEAIEEELEPGVGVPGSMQEVEVLLKGIEGYLDAQAIDEYRVHSFALLNDPQTLTYEQFPKVKVFAGSSSASCDSFGPRLAIPYHKAIANLAAEILTPVSQHHDTPQPSMRALL